MRIRILCMILALALVLAVPVRAIGGDPAEQLALEYFQAVRNGQSSFTTTAQTTDLTALLDQVFHRYPVLFFYYDGYSGTIYDSYSTATFQLKDVSVPWQDIRVVDSEQTMKALLGLGLAQLQQQVYFVTVNGYSVTSETLGQLANELMPETYLSYMGYQGNSTTYYTWEDNTISRYDLTIRYWDGIDPSVIGQWRDATEQAALQLAATLFAQDMPDYQKELLIHDWLVNNNRYNSANTKDPASHMAYGALVQGTCVCQGYGEAMLLLAQAAGIPCLYITGQAGNDGSTEGHGWNCVQINGQWYMLDVTWDDPTTTDGSDILQYDYFNVTSQQLAADHVWNQADYPQCTATAMNADYVRQLCQDSTAVYTQYSAELLVTQAEAIAMFQQALQNTAPVVPSAEETPSQVQPGQTLPQQTPEQTFPVTSQPGGSTDDSSGIGFIPVLLILAGAGTGIFLFIRKRREEAFRRRRRQVFDPTEPFSDYNFRR